MIRACKDLSFTCHLLHNAWKAALLSLEGGGHAGIALCEELHRFTTFVLGAYLPHPPTPSPTVFECSHPSVLTACLCTCPCCAVVCVPLCMVLPARVQQVDAACAARDSGHSEVATAGVPTHSPCKTLAAFYFNADGGGVRPIPTYEMTRGNRKAPVCSKVSVARRGTTNGIVDFECGHGYCWGTCVLGLHTQRFGSYCRLRLGAACRVRRAARRGRAAEHHVDSPLPLRGGAGCPVLRQCMQLVTVLPQSVGAVWCQAHRCVTAAPHPRGVHRVAESTSFFETRGSWWTGASLSASQRVVLGAPLAGGLET